MEYTDEEIAYAFRLLNERETLDDKEVEEWFKSPAHRRLMNEMEGARQRWENETADGEQARAAREEEERLSRQKTLRWTIALVIFMALLLLASRVARG
jgi:ferric-dicitrate binding protein FerR (iron transport regulator)